MDNQSAVVMVIITLIIIFIIYTNSGYGRQITSNGNGNSTPAPAPAAPYQGPPEVKEENFQYQQYLESEFLDSEVFDTHNQFMEELGHKTTGASMMSMRTDDNEIVPRVGLRRTDYRTVSADENARTVHSEQPYQMYAQNDRCYTSSDPYY